MISGEIRLIVRFSESIPNFRLVHVVQDNVCHSLITIRVPKDLKNFFLSIASPGPLAAVKASSPMKKSRSSVPLFADKAPPDPAPPVRKDGLFATAGLPDPEPPEPPAGPFVAMAVGKTKEGESLPANPIRN